MSEDCHDPSAPFGFCKVCGVELVQAEAELAMENGLWECEPCTLEGDQAEMRCGYRFHPLVDEES